MANASLAHLSPPARAQAELDNAERVRSLRRDRWIDYPRASEALRLLQRLLETPPRERMPCMLLHGDSNIGKTLITRKFERAHPPGFDKRRGVERRDIIAMQMPATPDQHRFYTALLFELKAPHPPRTSLSVLESLARGLLRDIRPRMLIVDEVHHLLGGGHREQRASLNLLKYLANDLKLSVVLVGTDDARIALQTDAQMMSRFTPFELPRWRENDEFRRLLSSFERVLPLRNASNLAEAGVARFVLARSAGLTGQVSRLLNDAAEIAIADGAERITVELLEEADRVAFA